jgi:ABC-type multidrug transport system permease subunit
MEIFNKAYLRNIIAPVNYLIYIMGMALTTSVLVFFQVLVLLIVAQTRLDINVLPVFFELSFVLLILIIIFVLLGMIIAYVFKTVQSSTLVTTFAALVLFMFGDTLSPLEAMPPIARVISSINPFVIGTYLVKQIILFNMPIGIMSSKLFILSLYILLLAATLVMLVKAKNSKRT